MYYGEIKTFDVANGPGVRTTLFVSGCRHHCEGCFQPETWNFTYGRPFTGEAAERIMDSLKPDYITGLTLLGGEPFEPENQRELVPFLKEVRTRFPKKDIWCFSGYRLEELTGRPASGETGCGCSHPPRCEVTDEMLALIDVLVDGEFELANKSLSLQFRGSSNQRILQVQASLQAGEAVLWRDERSLESLIEGGKRP